MDKLSTEQLVKHNEFTLNISAQLSFHSSIKTSNIGPYSAFSAEKLLSGLSAAWKTTLSTLRRI